MVPLPPVPRWVPWVAGVVWAGVVVSSAIVAQQHGFALRVVALLLATIAPVAFAAAGGGLIIQRWQRREWMRRTRYLLENLIDDALRVLTRLAETSYETIVEALPEEQRRRIHRLDSAFRLPLAELQVQAMRDAAVIVKGVMGALRVASRNAKETWIQAEKAHFELFEQYLDEGRRETEAILGTVRAEAPATSEAPATTLSTGDDMSTQEPRDMDEASAIPRVSFPEGDLPFEIAPDAVSPQQVVRRSVDALPLLQADARQLYDTVVELSAYVPSLAHRLVAASIDLRSQILSRTGTERVSTPRVAGTTSGASDEGGSLETLRWSWGWREPSSRRTSSGRSVVRSPRRPMTPV